MDFDFFLIFVLMFSDNNGTMFILWGQQYILLKCLVFCYCKTFDKLHIWQRYPSAILIMLIPALVQVFTLTRRLVNVKTWTSPIRLFCKVHKRPFTLHKLPMWLGLASEFFFYIFIPPTPGSQLKKTFAS